MGQSSGRDGRRVRRRYTTEFKKEAVHLLRRRRAQGSSSAQVARELGIGPGLLWEWARKLDPDATRQEPMSGVPGESVEDEVKRLRREVATLREERDFAKKAAAFFLKESL